MASEEKFKVVLLGEGCVGKTSLLLRYTKNQFQENHLVTLQASFIEKRLNVAGRRVKLHIWDTAGQERFHALGPIYYRESNGALLVYDITDADSFEKVKNWVKELRTMLQDNVALVIAGNKSDLDRNRVISEEQAEEFAASVGAVHMPTSAKLDRGVKEVFLHLTKRMLERRDSGEDGYSGGGAGAGGNRKNKNKQPIILDDDTPTGNSGKKEGCPCGS